MLEHAIELNKDQRKIEEYLCQIIELINLSKEQAGCLSYLRNIFLKNTFLRNQIPANIYFYGSIGGGKTMLMKRFYEKLDVSKEIIHYQKFMHYLHLQLHNIQGKNNDKIISKLAADIAKRSKVVCIDELEIKDITDAMLIMRLFDYLRKEKVFLFITTNTHPDNLYKDGIQRESFLPFIEYIKKDYKILCLESEKDYRYNILASSENRMIFPISDESKKIIADIRQKLCDADEWSEVKVDVFGREIVFTAGHQNLLFTNFSELFERDIGYADYVNITEKFNIIIIQNIRKITENETDIATRFINFIDNAYFNKVLLFMEAESSVELLYTDGKKINEFKRTISRLNEMNSWDA